MFCKQCGNPLEPGSSFCRNCGAPASGTSQYTYDPHTGGKPYPAPKKKKTGLIITLAVILVLAAALIVALTRQPAPQSNSNSSSGGSDAFAAADEIIIDLDDITLAQPDETGDLSEFDTPDEPDGFTVDITQDEPAYNEPSPSGSGSQPDPQQQPQTDMSSYVTTERPDLGDFLWYVESVHFDGPPAGRTPATSFSEVTGGWKAYIWYNPDSTENGGWDFLNIAIDGSAASAAVTFDWYMMTTSDTGNTLDVTSLADTTLYGDYSQSVLSAGDPGYMVYLTEFYYYNGRQFGLGYMIMESGEDTYVALVRP